MLSCMICISLSLIGIHCHQKLDLKLDLKKSTATYRAPRILSLFFCISHDLIQIKYMK